MMSKITGISVFLFYIATFAQAPSLKTFLTAASCTSEPCLTAAFAGSEMFLRQTDTTDSGIYHRYEDRKDQTTPPNLILTHGKLSGENYEVSLIILNHAYSATLFEELSTYNFRKVKKSGYQGKFGSRYSSPDYPNLDIMWEKLVPRDGKVFWIIALIPTN